MPSAQPETTATHRGRRGHRARATLFPSPLCSEDSSMPVPEFNEVGVAFNQKIEAPVQVDAGLPDAFSFVVLLGLQRRVAKVLHQELGLFVKGLLHCCRR